MPFPCINSDWSTKQKMLRNSQAITLLLGILQTFSTKTMLLRKARIWMRILVFENFQGFSQKFWPCAKGWRNNILQASKFKDIWSYERVCPEKECCCYWLTMRQPVQRSSIDLTLKMTSAHIVETLFTNNVVFQDSTHSEDQVSRTRWLLNTTGSRLKKTKIPLRKKIPLIMAHLSWQHSKSANVKIIRATKRKSKSNKIFIF